ncbi:hypothetical protein OSTOST_18778, partial [Ostertagia ostertagi]
TTSITTGEASSTTVAASSTTLPPCTPPPEYANYDYQSMAAWHSVPRYDNNTSSTMRSSNQRLRYGIVLTRQLPQQTPEQWRVPWPPHQQMKLQQLILNLPVQLVRRQFQVLWRKLEPHQQPTRGPEKLLKIECFRPREAEVSKQRLNHYKPGTNEEVDRRDVY